MLPTTSLLVLTFGMIPVEFHQGRWSKKTRVHRLANSIDNLKIASRFSYNEPISHEAGSRGITAAALFTLTVFRRGGIIYGATFRRRRPALASPRCHHRRAVRYYNGTQQSWRAANSGVAVCVNTRPARPCWQTAAAMACCKHRNRQTEQTHIGQNIRYHHATDGRTDG